MLGKNKKISSAFGYTIAILLLLIGIIGVCAFVIFLQNQARQNEIKETTFEPSNCVGWEEAENARSISLPSTATIDDFSVKNSAFSESSDSSSLDETAQNLPNDDNNSIICSGFSIDPDLLKEKDARSIQVEFSLAAEAETGSEDIVSFEYSLGGSSWRELESVAIESGMSNFAQDGYRTYDIMGNFAIEEIPNLQFRVTHHGSQWGTSRVFIDGVSLKLGLQKKLAIPELPPDIIRMAKFDFSLNESPTFSIKTEDRSIFSYLGSTKVRTVNQIDLIGPDGSEQESDISFAMQKNGMDSERLYTLKTENFSKPGLYKIEVQIVQDGVEQTIEQLFWWGALGVNVRESIGSPTDTTEVSIGYVDEEGKTICNGDIDLVVTDPNGDVQKFSTKDATIAMNKTCVDKSVTNDPDYSASVQTPIEGAYMMSVVAHTASGDHTMQDSFVISSDAAFSVVRSKFPTRIYPLADYPVSFSVTPKESFTGTIVERVPAWFELYDVSNDGIIFTPEDGMSDQTITWNVSLEAGQTYTFDYTFNPPDIAPALFLFGPITIGDFSESRKWQIASDSVGMGAAARLWSIGYELNSTTANEEMTATAGTAPTISNSTYRSGSYALQTSATAGTSISRVQFKASNTVDDFYIRAYVRIATLPGSLVPIIAVRDSGGTYQASIRLNSTGSLELWDEEGTGAVPIQVGSDSTTTLSTNTWYRIEMRVDCTTIASTILDGRIDGVSFASGTVSHDNGIYQLDLGVITTETATILYDDVAINDDSGSLDPNWPGPGKIIHLRPNGINLNECDASPYTELNEVNPDDATSGTSSYVVCDVNNDDLVVNLEDATASPFSLNANDRVTLAQAGIRFAHADATGSASSYIYAQIPTNKVTTSARTYTNATWWSNTQTAPYNYMYTTFQQSSSLVGGGATPLITPSDLDNSEVGMIATDAAPDVWVTALWLLVEYEPADGGRQWSSGFELQSATAGVEWETVNGSPTISTTTFNGGLASLRISSLSSATTQSVQETFKSTNTDGPFYGRFYLRMDSPPSANNRIMAFKDSVGTDRAYLELTSDRKLSLFDEDGQVGSSSTVQFVPEQWYRIEIQFNSSATGDNDTIEAKIDGAAAFASSSTRNLTNGITAIELGGNLNGESQTTGDWYFDDVAVNQNIGTTQNGYPGAGMIVHMQPDSAGDTVTWTNDYTYADELTPNDDTDALTSAAAGNIEDVNLETSSNAGIPSSSTINLVSVGVRMTNTNVESADATIGLRLKENSSSGAGGAAIIMNKEMTVGFGWTTNASASPKTYAMTAYDLPHKSGAWTTGTLDTTQIGVRSIYVGLETASVSTLWLMVDYTPPATNITVSGNIYSAEPSTAYDCSANTITVRLTINGSATESTADCTLNTGAYSITTSAPTFVGDAIAVFIDSGESISGTTVTLATSTTANITSLPIFVNRVALTHETSSSVPMRNLKLERADNGNAGIRYAVSTAALTTESGMELHITSGKTYIAGGTVTTNATGGNFHVASTAAATLDTATSTIGLAMTIEGTLNISASTNVNGDSNTVVVSGGTLNQTGGTFTVGNGTVETMAMSSGSANFSGGTTIITDELDVTGGTFTISNTFNLTNATSYFEVTGGTINVNDPADINLSDRFYIHGDSAVMNLSGGSMDSVDYWLLYAGTFNFSGGDHHVATTDATGSLYFNGSSVIGITFNMTGSGTITTRELESSNNARNFTGTNTGGTIIINGDNSTLGLNVIEATNPMNFTNITIAGTTTVVSTSTLAVTNDFTINSGQTLTTNNATLPIGDDLIIGSSAVLVAGSSAIGVGGDFTNNGTFTAGSSTVTMGGATGGAINGTNDTTFWNLAINPTGGLQNVDINGSDDPIISNNLNITSSDDILSVGLSNTITINPAATFTFTGYFEVGTIIYKSTTAFPTSGTFSGSTTKVRFDTTSNNVTMSARSYNNVEVYGNNTSRAVMAASGTYTISVNLTLTQDGTGTTSLDLNTNDPVLTVNGDVSIDSSTTLTPSGTSALKVKGDITCYGSFAYTAGSNLTLEGTSLQTINGTLDWLYDFTITNSSGSDPQTDPSVYFAAGSYLVINHIFYVNTAGVKMSFNPTSWFVNAGINFNGSSGAGNQVYLRSSTAGSRYIFELANVFGQTLTYVDAKDADSSPSDTINATGTGNVNSGNNVNWNFGSVRVAGTIYTDDGVTPYNCTTDAGGQLDIAVSTNGGAQVTGACTSTDGTFSINATTPAVDQPIVLYISSAESKKATTATLAASTMEDASMNIYENRLLIDSESGSQMTNALLSTGDNGNAGIRYAVSGGALTVESGLGLYILSGRTFAPAGAVTTTATATAAGSAGDVNIAGALTMATNKLTVGGDFDGSGTYTISSGQDTEFTATGTGFTIVDGTVTFQDVIFNGIGGGWSFSSLVNITGDLTMTNGTLSGTNDILVSGGDVTGDGEINLTGGTLSLSGTGNFGGSGNDWTFYNLTYAQSGVSNMTTTGTGTNQINISNILTTSTSGGYNHILKGGSKTWRVTAYGTPFVNNGRFEGQTSTFEYYHTNLDNVMNITQMNNQTTNYYYNLSIWGSGFHRTVTTVLPSGTSYVTGYLFMDSDDNGALAVDGQTNNPTLYVTGNLSCGAHVWPTITSGTGTWTVSGDVDFSNCDFSPTTGHTLVMNGTSKTLTQNTNSLYNATLSGSITLANETHIIAGDLVLSGTITAGTSEVKMTGASKTINGGAESLYNFTVDISGTGTITTTSAGFFITKGLTVAADDTFSVGIYGVWWRGDTFSMQSTSTISGTGILYVDTTTILGEVGTISAGVGFYTGNGYTTVMPDRPSYGYDGYVEVVSDSASPRTLTMQAGTIDITGNLTVDSEGSSSLTLDGDTNDPMVNVGGDMTWSQLDMLNGTPNTTSGTGTWTVSGNFTDANCYSDEFAVTCYTATSGNTLVMAGTSKTLTALSFTGSVFSNVTVSGTIGFDNKITVSDTLLITGTLTADTGTSAFVTLYIGSTFRNNGTFIHNNGAVYFNGVAPVIDGSNDTTFYYLTIGPSGSGTVTVDTDTGTDDPSVTGTLSIVAGDTLAIESGRTVTFTGGAHTFSFSGTLSGAGTFIYRSSTAFPTTGTANSIVRFDATNNNVSVTGSRSFGGAVEVYNTSNIGIGSVTFGTAGSQTFTLSSSLTLTRTGSQGVAMNLTTQDPIMTVSGDVIINTGTTLSLSDVSNLYIQGNYSNAGTLTHNGSASTDGVVIFDNRLGETKTIDSTGAAAAAFNNIYFRDIPEAGPIYQLESALDVDNDLNILAGTLNTKASESNPITVAGDWAISALPAAFVANSSIVTLDGNAQQTVTGEMTGSSAFYDLVITNNSGTDPDTDPSVIFASDLETDGTFTANTANTKLRFAATGTYTLQNIDFDGQATGTRLSLRSSSQGTQWDINVAGTRSVSNTDVRDSNACGQAPDIDATDGTNYDATNNDCWLIDSLTFAISDTTIGFGSPTSGASRYATADANGSASEVEAHTIGISTNAEDGYTLTVYGPTLTSAGNTIDAIGGVNTAPAPGTEQFGLRMTASGGSGTVSAPYADSGFAYDGASSPDQVASSATASALTTYSVRYLVNLLSATEAGIYASDLTYVITSNF